MSPLDADRADLIDLIGSAFAIVPYPGDENIITNRRDLESQEIAQAFRGHHWRGLSFAMIFEHRDSLPFLSPEGFRFYLPAYLIAAISHYDDGDTLFEFVVYQLTPPRGPAHKNAWKWFHENMRLMTADQHVAIRRFLKYVLKHYSLDFPNCEPQYALDVYWSKDP